MSEWVHRAKIRLIPRDIMRALGAPDSVDLRRVIVTDDPEGVWLLIEHPDLERVAVEAEAPILTAEQADAVFSEISAHDAYR